MHRRSGARIPLGPRRDVALAVTSRLACAVARLVALAPASAHSDVRVDANGRRARARPSIAAPQPDESDALLPIELPETGTRIVAIGDRVARRLTAAPNPIELQAYSPGRECRSGGSWEGRLLLIPRLGR